MKRKLRKFKDDVYKHNTSDHQSEHPALILQSLGVIIFGFIVGSFLLVVFGIIIITWLAIRRDRLIQLELEEMIEEAGQSDP